MPAGTSWPRYIGAVIGAMLSMLAGSQVVHTIYQPLRELDARVQIEKEKLLALQKQALKEKGGEQNKTDMKKEFS